MSRLFAYMGNEPERIRCALFPARSALATDVGPNPDGWGLGFYQGGEVLLQKRPKAPPGVIDFYAQLRELRTDVVVGHVRSATVGRSQKTENTHPYRFRSWLFAHSGTIPRFDQIREELLESVPDFLRRNIRGQTDSEHIFHLLLAFLHDAGKLDDIHLSTELLRGAVRSTAAFLDRLIAAAGGGTPELNLIATNGRILVATRRGRPMALLRTSGISDCPVCREPGDRVGRESKRVSHEHLRALLLLSNGELPGGADGAPLVGPGWEAVPEGSVLTVTHAIQTDLSPLREEGRPPA